MVWPVWVVQALWAVGLSIVRRIYGTIWVPDSNVLGYKTLPPEPIRKKAKK